MERFGSDKPDLRFGLEMRDLTDLVSESEFGIFREVCASGGRVRGLAATGCAHFSRKETDELADIAKIYKAKGIITLKIEEGQVRGSVAKYLSEDAQRGIVKRLQAVDGDLVIITADDPEVSAVSLGQVRRFLGRKLGLIREGDYKLLWVTEFPLFEWNPDENRWEAKHHIFTQPREQDLPILESDPAAVKGRLYDLVLNGVEMGSGSIRINNPELQKRVMNIVGTTTEDAERKFGFLLHAYEYGGPVHGGFAIGFDRLIAVILGLENLRDVIAFPQNAAGVSLVDDCPNEIDLKQWQELHIRPAESVVPRSGSR
jgi:aspartyl-tRNA synthetase